MRSIDGRICEEFSTKYYGICTIGGMLSAGTTPVKVRVQVQRHFSKGLHSVDLLYRDVIKRKKEECSRGQQLAVTCAAGYAAGAVGTFVFNPADNIAMRRIGLLNLFTRSIPIRFMLVSPVITMQWFLYDNIKVLAGLEEQVS
ncbi:hypothetical protein MKX03_013353, partial [Papaver bracteatum]